MKIHILFTFKSGPYGGVNQFLKALRDYFVEKELYTEDVQGADIILFNSGHNIEEVLRYKKIYPDKIFVQRMDGPSRLYNKMSDKRDLVANTMNHTIADATVFQSMYSRDINYKMGLKKSRYETTIINAPNGKIFFPGEKKQHSVNGKCRLIASSWSNNYNKGFQYYHYLDEHLDFSKYSMTFVGNSPIEFKNIKHIPPLNSEELSNLLRESDIYITGSKKDPCSNALIEAMFCGLPAVALNDGGHPEIVKKAGRLFNGTEDIIECIEDVCNHREEYINNIQLKSMDEVGRVYAEFFERLSPQMEKDGYKVKSCTLYSVLQIKTAVFICKVYEKKERMIRLVKKGV